MGKSSAPKPPNPKDTASASTSTNIGTAVANAFMGNVNQNTPDGSLTYNQSGNHEWYDPYTGKRYNIPTFTATQTLSPQQQAIKTQEDRAQQNLAGLAAQQSGFLKDYLGNPFSMDGAPEAPDPSSIGLPKYTQYAAAPQLAETFGDAGKLTRSYNTDFSKDRQRVEDAMFARMQTQIDADREREESRLANQGVRLGSTAYGNAQDNFQRGVNDARLATILAGGQEQSRLVGLERDRAAFQNSAQQQAYEQLLGRANFGNNARQQNFSNQFQVTGANNQLQDQQFNAAMAQQQAQQQARNAWLSEQFATRNQPINEISALLSGAQVSSPNFVNTSMPRIPTTDVAGLINTNYNQRLQAYQQQQAQAGGLISGIGGLFGSLIGLSDDDAKKDKERIGEVDGDMGLWKFRYKSDPKSSPKRIGLMASEVQKAKPAAVKRGKDGYRYVDYGKALGLMNA